MRVLLRPLLLLVALVGLVAGAAPAAAGSHPVRVHPLAQAHAHNDYDHTRPLFDALDHGFASVESDIFLVEGKLLVGHSASDLTPDRTLQSLYLEPLRQRVLAGHGKVYPGSTVLFQLLIDVKSSGVETYTALDKVLRSPRYAFLFTRFTDGHVRRGPITAVISGERPRELMAGQRDRLAFYDGRIIDTGDLGPGDDPKLTPLVSDNWTKLFTWTGAGEMPADQRAKLREIVATAHAAGQRVRLWETPDVSGPERGAVWRELVAADVDQINTDDLAGLQKFLTNH